MTTQTAEHAVGALDAFNVALLSARPLQPTLVALSTSFSVWLIRIAHVINISFYFTDLPPDKVNSVMVASLKSGTAGCKQNKMV